MRWQPVVVVILVGACSFELDPVVTDPASGGAGASTASGGTPADADCVTLGCSSGGATTGGTGAVGGSATGGVAGGVTGGTAGTGAFGGTAGSGAGGGGGTGPTGGSAGYQCANVLNMPDCDFPDPYACLCQGCDAVYCVDPSQGFPISDCVCPSCYGFPDCGTQYCVDDGVCDPFGEGCDCPDCYYHPACY